MELSENKVEKIVIKKSLYVNFYAFILGDFFVVTKWHRGRARKKHTQRTFYFRRYKYILFIAER